MIRNDCVSSALRWTANEFHSQCFCIADKMNWRRKRRKGNDTCALTHVNSTWMIALCNSTFSWSKPKVVFDSYYRHFFLARFHIVHRKNRQMMINEFFFFLHINRVRIWQYIELKQEMSETPQSHTAIEFLIIACKFTFFLSDILQNFFFRTLPPSRRKASRKTKQNYCCHSNALMCSVLMRTNNDPNFYYRFNVLFTALNNDELYIWFASNTGQILWGTLFL